MRGHDHIIEQRMDGKKPAFVFVNDFPCKLDWVDCGELPTICTHGDNLKNIDLRFLVGCNVSICSENEDRAKSLFALIKSIGATTVAATHIQRSQHASNQAGWASVYTKDSING
jgi:hypothetical protein